MYHSSHLLFAEYNILLHRGGAAEHYVFLLMAFVNLFVMLGPVPLVVIIGAWTNFAKMELLYSYFRMC